MHQTNQMRGVQREAEAKAPGSTAPRGGGEAPGYVVTINRTRGTRRKVEA